MGPCVRYDDNGLVVPESGKTLDDMDIHELRWYHDYATRQVAMGEYVGHNKKMLDYITQLEPHVLTYDPVVFHRPRKTATLGTVIDGDDDD